MTRSMISVVVPLHNEQQVLPELHLCGLCSIEHSIIGPFHPPLVQLFLSGAINEIPIRHE